MYKRQTQDFEKVFADYDLILGPTAPSVAFDLDSLNHDPVAMYLADLLTIPVNLAGLPGISIPAGFAQGLPVGLQLIGPKYSEETIDVYKRQVSTCCANLSWRLPIRG